MTPAISPVLPFFSQVLRYSSGIPQVATPVGDHSKVTEQGDQDLAPPTQPG